MSDENQVADTPVPPIYPCPECKSTRGYVKVGIYRSQCLGCNALLKNEEIGESS